MSTWPNQVTIGDFTADNNGTNDFRVTAKLTGWDDAAPARTSIQPKAQQAGGWDASGYSDSRVIGIEGVVVQASAADAMAVRDQLAALTKLSTHQLTVVNAVVGPRSANVWVTAAAVITWIGDQSFSYTLGVTATDPLKYGPLVPGSTTLASSAGGTGRVWPRVWPTDYGVPPGVTPGAVTVANAGTASYFPRLRVNGPVTNPVITLVETGDVVRFNGFIAAGQHLDINWGVPRRVTIGDNPVSMRQKVSYVGNFLAVPVGGGNLAYSADDANPAATLQVWSYEGAWE